MATQTKPESTAGTSVARRVDSRVTELRERNELVRQIRGTQWGKDITDGAARAIAHYCNTNGLDATRHVEILGGKIYLTAEFYEERGATLLLSGQVKKAEPDFINADARLEKMAAEGNDWAIAEQERRLRERITHNVPEAAKAAVVQRFTIEGGGTVVGVNWCGGTGRRDPVGDAEPTKTAITRAARRAWKQIAEVIPGYGAQVKPIEASARIASDEIPVSVVEAPREVPPVLGSGEEPYAESVQAKTQPDDFQDDRDLAG